MIFENVMDRLESLADKMSIGDLPPAEKVKAARAVTAGSALVSVVVGVLSYKYDNGVLAFADAAFTLIGVGIPGCAWADARDELFRLTATPEERAAKATRQVQSMFSHPGL